MLLLLLLLQADSPRELVEKLRSDRIEERDDAARRLRALGKAAVPELEKAAKELELAARLLKAIALAGEIPEIVRRFPGVEERLVSGGPGAWRDLFFKLRNREKEEDPSLETFPRSERVLLVRRSFAGAADVHERLAVLGAARQQEMAEAIPEIAGILKAPDDGCHNLALATLGEIGTSAEAPLLRAALRSSEAGTRCTAVEAFLRVWDSDSAKALIACLRDPSSGVRHKAAEVISWREVAEAVPALVGLLSDEEPLLRVDALAALDRLGATGEVDRIAPLLKDGNVHIRLHAAAALCRLGSRKGVVLFLETPQETAEDVFSYRVDNVRYTSAFRPLPLHVLNGARQPEVWRRLKEAKFVRGSSLGTNRAALEKFGRDSKLALAIPEVVPTKAGAWLSEEFHAPYDWEPATPLHALERGQYYDVRFILEPDRIRIVSPEEEATFWRAWGEELKK